MYLFAKNVNGAPVDKLIKAIITQKKEISSLKKSSNEQQNLTQNNISNDKVNQYVLSSDDRRKLNEMIRFARRNNNDIDEVKKYLLMITLGKLTQTEKYVIYKRLAQKSIKRPKVSNILEEPKKYTRKR